MGSIARIAGVKSRPSRIEEFRERVKAMTGILDSSRQF
jgi:hypothetical protein